MPSAPFIAQFERRLAEMGCPARRLREKVRELADHYEDLKLAALEDGLPENEAGALAAAKLGDPVVLAENIMTGVRQSSWWGRHPFIGFCLLPPLVSVVLWPACGGAFYSFCRLLGRLFGPAYDCDVKTASVLCDDPVAFHSFLTPLKEGVDAVTYIILTAGFCWLARRSAVGLKWMLATCAACVLTSLFFFCSIHPHNFTMGFGWPFQCWPNAVVPLAVGFIALVSQRRMENRRSPVPHETK
jgi:hypothetical protein